VHWKALVWVGSPILTSASLRSTLETGVLSPRPAPEILSTEVAAWAHWSGVGEAGPTNIWHNMALFTILPAVPLGNTQMAPGGAEREIPRPNPIAC
jgi:hypothetical protein